MIFHSSEGMGITSWIRLQPLKKRLQLLRERRKAAEEDMEAMINERIVLSSMEQIADICTEKGFVVSVAVFPDAKGKFQCTYSVGGTISRDTARMLERVFKKVDLDKIMENMNRILYPPLKPTLPRNKEEYDSMVEEMARKVREGVPVSGYNDLIHQMLITGDIKSVDQVLDSYNQRHNGGDPIGS